MRATGSDSATGCLPDNRHNHQLDLLALLDQPVPPCEPEEAVTVHRALVASGELDRLGFEVDVDADLGLVAHASNLLSSAAIPSLRYRSIPSVIPGVTPRSTYTATRL